MKRVLLAALIALNLALLVCVLHVNSPAANAQAARGAPDYLAVTARNGNAGQDALFVLHLGQRKMLCWAPDPVSGKLILQGARVVDLKHDFGRDRD
jgi:hypothetical protein